MRANCGGKSWKWLLCEFESMLLINLYVNQTLVDDVFLPGSIFSSGQGLFQNSTTWLGLFWIPWLTIESNRVQLLGTAGQPT